MKNLVATLCLSFAVLIGCAEESPDLFLAGLDTYEREDYATALSILQPLAEQGHAAAQSNLGFMYSNGRGVAQDYRKLCDCMG